MVGIDETRQSGRVRVSKNGTDVESTDSEICRAHKIFVTNLIYGEKHDISLRVFENMSKFTEHFTDRV